MVRRASLGDRHRVDHAGPVASSSMVRRARRAGFDQAEVLALATRLAARRRAHRQCPPASGGMTTSDYLLTRAHGLDLRGPKPASSIRSRPSLHLATADIAILPIDGLRFAGAAPGDDTAEALDAARVLAPVAGPDPLLPAPDPRPARLHVGHRRPPPTRRGRARVQVLHAGQLAHRCGSSSRSACDPCGVGGAVVAPGQVVARDPVGVGEAQQAGGPAGADRRR